MSKKQAGFPGRRNPESETHSGSAGLLTLSMEWPPGEIQTSTKHVDALSGLSSDVGSIPTASTKLTGEIPLVGISPVLYATNFSLMLFAIFCVKKKWKNRITSGLKRVGSRLRVNSGDSLINCNKFSILFKAKGKAHSLGEKFAENRSEGFFRAGISWCCQIVLPVLIRNHSPYWRLKSL